MVKTSLFSCSGLLGRWGSPLPILVHHSCHCLSRLDHIWSQQTLGLPCRSLCYHLTLTLPRWYGQSSKWKCVNISFSCMVGKIHILYKLLSLSSVQWYYCSVTALFDSATLWTAACQASLPFPNSRNLLKFMFIESMMPSSHFILWCSLLLLPSIFPSIRVFSKDSALCITWPENWSFSFSSSPSNESSGLISFRIDQFDLLEAQEVFKSLLQHHSWKHQFWGSQPSLWSNSHIWTWLLGKP